MTAKLWPLLTVSIGAALLGFFLYRFASAKVWLDLKMIGWRFGLIVALEALVHVVNARAWWHMFPSQNRRGRFVQLCLVQLAGSALNDASPGAPLGGEPVKALLLKREFPLSMMTATLLSAKLAHALGRAFFIILGMVTVSIFLKLEQLPMKSLLGGFILTGAGLVAFMALQISGFSGWSKRLFLRLPLPGVWTERLAAALERVDGHLSDIYRTRPLDFAASVALVLIGLCVGVVQVWLLLGWIRLQRDWLSSLAIESFSVLVGFVLFVVPGSLGVQEGGKLLIFSALGMPLSAALSVGIAFRLNSLVNLAEGFVALVSLKSAPNFPGSRDG